MTPSQPQTGFRSVVSVAPIGTHVPFLQSFASQYVPGPQVSPSLDHSQSTPASACASPPASVGPASVGPASGHTQSQKHGGVPFVHSGPGAGPHGGHVAPLEPDEPLLPEEPLDESPLEPLDDENAGMFVSDDPEQAPTIPKQAAAATHANQALFMR